MNKIDYLGETPEFLYEYLDLDILCHLKDIGYFCGMDYASKLVYDFPNYVSRYDHSLIVSKLVYKLTKDKTKSLAGLFHDIATPAFSHVIDYLNGDFISQESTEKRTYEILNSSDKLKKCLQKDGLIIDDIDFKKYSIVDNERPKLCADRFDGVITPSINWTKTLKVDEVGPFIEDIYPAVNEFGEEEIGFRTYDIANKFTILSDKLNIECQSNYDTYMMLLLAEIIRYALNNGYITYEDLYYNTEKNLFELLNKCAKNDYVLFLMLDNFYKINKDDIIFERDFEVKNKILNPLVNGVRLRKMH